jgi:hypothetical protein
MSKPMALIKHGEKTSRRRRGSVDLTPWAAGTIEDALGDSGIRLVTREPVTRWRRISQRRFNKILRNVVGKKPRKRNRHE